MYLQHVYHNVIRDWGVAISDLKEICAVVFTFKITV